MNIVGMRMQFIVQFDEYVRNKIGDENILNMWLMGGLPDGADLDEIHEIARDDELWLDMVQCFSRCCRSAGKI